jgi:hypothetical protein
MILKIIMIFEDIKNIYAEKDKAKVFTCLVFLTIFIASRISGAKFVGPLSWMPFNDSL